MYKEKKPKKSTSYLNNFIQNPGIDFYKTDKKPEVTRVNPNQYLKNFYMVSQEANSSAHTLGMNTFMTTNPIGSHNLSIIKRQIHADYAKRSM
jgi:hypothetical protein